MVGVLSEKLWQLMRRGWGFSRDAGVVGVLVSQRETLAADAHDAGVVWVLNEKLWQLMLMMPARFGSQCAGVVGVLSEKLWQLMLMMPAWLGFSVRSSGS